MLSLLLLAFANFYQETSDGFGRRVCGIADVNGDGTDDLVVADAGFRGSGAIWTVSGKDGSRIATALGSEQRMGLGESFFSMGKELCVCVTTTDGPALVYLSTETLKPLRQSEPVTRAQNFYSFVVPAGDIDGDGVTDALMSLVPKDLKRSFLELIAGKTGKRLRTIEVPLTRRIALGGAVASLVDLNGDGVPEIGVGTESIAQQYSVFVLSGKSGETLAELTDVGSKNGFGAAFGPVGDLDADGVNELAIVDDALGMIRLYSGRKLSHLHDFDNRWGDKSRSMEMGGVTTIRDLDGDGVREFGIAIDAWAEEQALIFSGKTGVLIRRHMEDGLDGRYGACIADVGDLDRDGKGDYAVGASHSFDGAARGSVFVYSGATGKRLFVLDEIKLAGK